MEDVLTQEELPTNVVLLDDLALKLWTKYFTPATPLEPARRKSLMNEYNLVVERRNRLSGFNALIKITPSTRIPFTPDVPIKCPGIGAPVQNISVEKTLPSAPKVTGGNIIQQILALHDQGLSNKEIIARGFNKSTVARQVGEYKKRKENGN